jgi:hypothetical protein
MQGMAFEVKCLSAIDAIAAVYRANPARSGAAYAAASPAHTDASAPEESATRSGRFPNHVFRIASRTSEPTAGE